MNRRDFLVHTANADCALTELTPCSALAQGDARARTIIAWKKRIDEMLGCGGLPIIDPQVTYVAGRTNVMRMLQNMKKLDVAQIAFAAANAPDSSPSP